MHLKRMEEMCFFDKWNLISQISGRLWSKEKIIVIYKALCFDVAQGRMNWTPKEKII